MYHKVPTMARFASFVRPYSKHRTSNNQECHHKTPSIKQTNSLLTGYIYSHPLSMQSLQSNNHTLSYFFVCPNSKPTFTMCRWYWQHYIPCQHHGKKRISCDMSKRLRWRCEGWADPENELRTITFSGSIYTRAVMKLCPNCRAAEHNQESH